MNAGLEKGLRAYVAGQLESEELEIGAGEAAYEVLAAEVGERPGVYSLHCNVSGDTMPGHVGWILAGVPSVQRVVDDLHKAEVAFAVCTPQGVEGFTEVDHQAAVAAVRGCFPDMPTLYRRRAQASTPEEIAAAQGALDAALLKLQACSAALQEANVAISDTSAWFVDSTRDGVMKDNGGTPRWEAVVALRMAVRELG